MQLSLPLWRPSRAAPLPPRRALDRPPAAGRWRIREELLMGSVVRVELWAELPRDGEAALEAALAEMRRIDRRCSARHLDSELSRVNRHAAAAPVAVSAELFALLTQAQAFSARSDGAFDITCPGPAGAQHRRAARPDAAVGWRRLMLDAATRSVRLAHPGVRIDLGSFAQGHAVDRGTAELRRHGIAHASVSAGNSRRLLGDRHGQPWTMAMRQPLQADDPIAALPLRDTAVSTASAEPRGAGAVRSVTVLAPDGATSAALSRSVFVLGIACALALVEAVPGADAVLVDAAGAPHASPGLQRR